MYKDHILLVPRVVIIYKFRCNNNLPKLHNLHHTASDQTLKVQYIYYIMIYEFLSHDILHQGLEQVNYLCKNKPNLSLPILPCGALVWISHKYICHEAFTKESQLL